jgi:hypothetical protein
METKAEPKKEQNDAQQENRGKPAWEKPALTVLGAADLTKAAALTYADGGGGFS